MIRRSGFSYELVVSVKPSGKSLGLDSRYSLVFLSQ